MPFFALNDHAERREGVKALLRQVHRQARTMTLDALGVLHRDHPALAIAVLTDDGEPATVGPLLHAGVLGVIPRQLEPRLILRALEIVLLGGYYVPICALSPDMQPLQLESGSGAGRLRASPAELTRAAVSLSHRVGRAD